MVDAFSLQDRVAIVTGAAQGIGREVAIVFAKAGANLVLVDPSISILKEVADEITKLGRKSMSANANVTIAAEVKQMIDDAISNFGRIDILVNNAGIYRSESIEQVAEEDWDKVLDVNLKGVYLCCRAVAPIMKGQKGGRIINISSIAGQNGGAIGAVSYSASKGGVIGFTKALARELGSFGITVNSIAPAVIATEVVRRAWGDRLQGQVSNIPVGRVGTPEDVAYAAQFLASEEAGYITGHTLDVNGGQLMRPG